MPNGPDTAYHQFRNTMILNLKCKISIINLQAEKVIRKRTDQQQQQLSDRRVQNSFCIQFYTCPASTGLHSSRQVMTVSARDVPEPYSDFTPTCCQHGPREAFQPTHSLWSHRSGPGSEHLYDKLHKRHLELDSLVKPLDSEQALAKQISISESGGLIIESSSSKTLLYEEELAPTNFNNLCNFTVWCHQRPWTDK